MTKATVSKKEITPAIPAVYEEVVTLEMTMEQAEQIKSLINKVDFLEQRGASNLSEVYWALNRVKGFKWKVLAANGRVTISKALDSPANIY